MKQLDLILSKFHLHSNRLTTADFAHDPALSPEYRRLLCQLRADPRYLIKTKRITQSLFEYTLIVIREDATGQRSFA